MKLTCIRCHKQQEQLYAPFCSDCGGLINPVYDMTSVTLKHSDNPYVRYSDLLPVNDSSLLPNDAIFTPVVHATRLGKLLGVPNLYLKNETVLNTGTTKYRMAAVSLAFLYENGVKHFCTSSTGNSSTAYAQLISNIPELNLSLFTAADFRYRVHFEPTDQINHFILKDATFSEAFEVAGLYAKNNGFTPERGFFNPGRREGLKLAYLEAVDQIPNPIDWYVQGVSSAMGVYGSFSGAKELLQLGHIPYLPHLLCCQQDSCAPMVKAWEEDSEIIEARHIVKKPQGIAMAILRGDPSKVYPYMRGIVKESAGNFARASEEKIRKARKLVFEEEGIDICYSAATAVAGVMIAANAKKIPASDTVLVNLTGRDQPVDAVVHGQWLKKINGQWLPQPTNSPRSSGSHHFANQ